MKTLPSRIRGRKSVGICTMYCSCRNLLEIDYSVMDNYMVVWLLFKCIVISNISLLKCVGNKTITGYSYECLQVSYCKGTD